MWDCSDDTFALASARLMNHQIQFIINYMICFFFFFVSLCSIAFLTISWESAISAERNESVKTFNDSEWVKAIQLYTQQTHFSCRLDLLHTVEKLWFIYKYARESTANSDPAQQANPQSKCEWMKKKMFRQMNCNKYTTNSVVFSYYLASLFDSRRKGGGWCWLWKVWNNIWTTCSKCIPNKLPKQD